jgi:putative transcriptional regulator
MVRCTLAARLSARRMTVAELARATDLNRSTLAALRHGSAARVDLKTIEILCRYFGCDVGELFVLDDTKGSRR